MPKNSSLNRRLAKNTSALLIFQVAKIVFPLLTLPYLTRVLSTNTYGTVSYVKTIMTYLQLLVDFGFILSGTRDIVKSIQDKERDNAAIQKTLSDTLTARVILGLLGFIITIIIALVLPIPRESLTFTLLSYLVVFESIFLLDFLFRGLEKMHVITIRFVAMKVISTLLTFLFVKNDSDMLLIPIFDIFSSTLAILLVYHQLKKEKLRIQFSRARHAIVKIKESSVFFLSNIASNSLSAISTIVIGIILTKADVALWGVCMQVIGTIQACYAPLSEGIFPEMIRNKNLSLIKKTLSIFTPLVFLGSALVAILAPWILYVLGGAEYQSATIILQTTTPCLFFGFLAIMIGWPTLGAIKKDKEVTKTTIFTLCFNAVALLLLIVTNSATLFSIAVVRALSDGVLFLSRLRYLLKFRKEFNYSSIKPHNNTRSSKII